MKKKLLLVMLPALIGLSLAALAMVLPAHASQAPVAAQVNWEDHLREARGILVSFPEALVGPWVVDKITYTATADTHFEQEAGPFAVGGCVVVKYNPSTFEAKEIQTTHSQECGGMGDEQFYGFIDKVPAEYNPTVSSNLAITSTWVISGVEFISTPRTEFEPEHGPLVVGACAKVDYRMVNGQNIAHEIASELPFRCLGPVAFNQIYGNVSSFPPDLLGTWVISTTGNTTFNFMTDPSTQFMDKHHFTTGICIGVKYYSSNGVNHAVLVWPTWDKLCQRVEAPVPSLLVATVDSLPTGTYTGTWVLAGVEFTATEKTRFETEEHPLKVGDCVAARYDATDGAMLLFKVEKEEHEACQSENGQSRFKVYGVVETLPISGTLVGAWQISGIPMDAISTTLFEQEHGLLALGSNVSAKFAYDAAASTRTALKIETRVAPGFGCLHHYGHLEWYQPATSQDGYSHWRIDGVAYLGDPGMEADSHLKIGSLVMVNAYQQNGSLIATQVNAAFSTFLPNVVR